MRSFLSAALLGGVLLAASIASSTALRVDNAQIVDASGNPIFLHGFNWFGFNAGTTMVDGVWGGPALAGDFATVVQRQKAMGFNAVRLPFSFKELYTNNNNLRSFVTNCTLPTAAEVAASVTPPGRTPSAAAAPLPAPPTRIEGLCNEYLPDSVLARYVWVVQFYARNGFYVVADNHLREDQTVLEDAAVWVRQWAQLAASLAADPVARERIILDILNEADSFGVRWEAAAGKPSQQDLYLAAMDAIEAAAPGLLFAIEGTGQGAMLTNWGDGFATAEANITAYKGNATGGGLSDPRPFFTALLAKPYRDRVVLAPHIYPASVSFSPANSTGAGLYDRLSTSFGTLMTEGYCAGSDCQRFAVLIGEFGSKFESVSDKETMADLAKYFNNEGAAADGRHLPIANWFYWSWNPNSGDTGGLVDDEWVNLQWEKVEYLQDSLGLGRTPDGFVPLPPPSPAARPLPIVGNSPSSASTSPPASAAFPVCRLASTLVLLLFLSLLL